MSTAFQTSAPAPGLRSSSTAVPVHRQWQKRLLVARPACSGAADLRGRLKAATAADLLQLPAAPDTGGVVPQRNWNAVCMAYLGDGVWEAALRQHFYDPTNLRCYNSTVTALANTQAQAACYQLLLGRCWVTADEAALMRWATNSSSVAPPASATRQQYKQATALETLVAHLYLTDSARLHDLLDWLLCPERRCLWRQPMPVRSSSAKQRSHGAASGILGSSIASRTTQAPHHSRQDS